MADILHTVKDYIYICYRLYIIMQTKKKRHTFRKKGGERDESLRAILDEKLSRKSRKSRGKSVLQTEIEKIPSQFPIKSYFSPKSTSNASEKWSYSEIDPYYKVDISSEIEKLKGVYEELLNIIEKYVESWEGNVKSKTIHSIKEIINIQTEIRKECTNKVQTIKCDEYLDAFISQLNGYKKRVETMIHNIEKINKSKSPVLQNVFLFKPKKMTRKTKKMIEIDLKKKRILFFLQYLIREINNTMKDIINM